MTWFYEQGVDEGGSYAQVPGTSSSEAFRDVYRRCLPTFFLTARLANPTAQLILYTNRELSQATAVARLLRSQLDEAGVDVRVLPYISTPPSGWFDAWRNQFYVLDVLNHLATTKRSDSDAFVILDSDVVWTGAPAEPLWQAIDDVGCLSYDLGFPLATTENGLTAYELSAIGSVLTGLQLPPVSYQGGEIQALRGDMLDRVSQLSSQLWQLTHEMFARDEKPIREEAHLLSIVYATLSVAAGSANPFIKRCWTQTRTYVNLTGDETTLVLWHTPSEKRFGLKTIYRDLVAGRGELQDAGSGPLLTRYLSRRLGVPTSPLGKRIRDDSYRLLELAAQFGRRTRR